MRFTVTLLTTVVLSVGVVNVGDLGDVDHSRVGDVNVLNVRGTGVVRRQKHVTRAKREPRYAGESAAESDRGASMPGPPPPTKPTSAGAYTGRTAGGPGTHPQ